MIIIINYDIIVNLKIFPLKNNNSTKTSTTSKLNKTLKNKNKKYYIINSNKYTQILTLIVTLRTHVRDLTSSPSGPKTSDPLTRWRHDTPANESESSWATWRLPR